MEARLAAAERSSSEPIAIVGVGCRFPGSASNIDQLWRILRDGVDAITPIPAERWAAGVAPETSPPAARWAGTLNDIAGFDAAFFNMSPREAERMDPQHRLLLEVAWEALEDAGLAPARLAGSKTGVFVGLSGHDHERLVFAEGTPLDAYDLTGNAPAYAASRLSHVFDFRGPCICLDAACASSLAAVHLACGSLRKGDCDLALAGGVNLILSPLLAEHLVLLQVLSPDGRCRTFDARANGFVRAEGCGVAVLKRLSDAQRDGDRIWAVIRGTAVTQNGRSTSLTAPSVKAQADVLRAALEDGKVSPARIGYVEVHSNGSPLGDPMELEALRAVLGAPRADGSTCVLGSVKTNLGHLEAVSGMAGLLKTLLVLRHGLVPGNLHFRVLNPRASLEGTPFVFSRDEVPWPSGLAPRLAGVSSTGMSGTNAHLVLEEAPPVPASSTAPDRPLHLLALTARSEEALRAQAARMVEHLAAHFEQPLGDICHTTLVGRAHFEHRIAVVVSTAEQLSGDLRALVDGARSSAVARGRVDASSGKRLVAFLFTGRGAETSPSTSSELATHPAFRSAIQRCEDALRARAGSLPAAPMSSGPLPEGLSHEDFALFSLQVALAEAWRAWGIEPGAVGGEGVGACVAAWASGCLDLPDALSLLLERARLARSAGEEGLALFMRALQKMPFRPPRCLLVPSAADAPGNAPAASANFWARQVLRAPGRLLEALAPLAEHGPVASLELGPRPVLQEGGAPKDLLLLPSLRADAPAWHTLLDSLAQLFVLGVPVDWKRFDEPFQRRRVSLPTYPFQRKQYRIAPAPSRAARDRDRVENPLPGRRLVPFAHDPSLQGWEYQLDRACLAALHARPGPAFSRLLDPAALAEVLRAAAHTLCGDRPGLLRLSMPAPLVAQGEEGSLQILATVEGDARLSFRLFHRVQASAAWTLVGTGGLDPHDEPAPGTGLGEAHPLAELPAEVASLTSPRSIEAGGPGGDALRIERLWHRGNTTFAHLSAGAAWNERGLEALVNTALAAADTACPARGWGRWTAHGFDGLALVGPRRIPAWLRLRWVQLTDKSATLEVALHDEDGATVASARRLDLCAEEPIGAPGGETQSPEDAAFHDVTWIVRPRAPSRSPAARGRRWLLLSDRGGVGARLAGELRAKGDDCSLVYMDEGIDAAIARIPLPGAGPAFSGIVLLWPLDAPAVRGDLAPDTLDEAHHAGSIAALALVERSIRRAHRPQLWFVTRGATTAGKAVPGIAQAALWGLGRALAVERPDLWGGAIDLDTRPNTDEHQRIADEICEPDGEDAIAFRDERRLVARLMPAVIPAPAAPLEVRPDRTYLVVGSPGVTQASIAEWLSERGARHLRLVSGGPQELDARALEGRGVSVKVIHADVADEASLANLLRELPCPPGGVVYIAGPQVAARRSLDSADAHSLHMALRTQVRGALLLHHLTRGVALDFFVLLSSATSIHGSREAHDSAAVDAFLDALAHHRRAAGLPATSIHWVHARQDGDSAQTTSAQLEASGLRPLLRGAALAGLERALVADRQQLTVLQPDPASFGQAPARHRPFFEAMAQSGAAVRAREADLRARLAVAPSEEQQRLLDELLRTHVAQLLGLDAARIPANQPLVELGMSSIVGVQLAIAIAGALGRSVPAAVLLEHPTLASLSAHLAQAFTHEQDRAASTYTPLVSLQRGGTRPPFFCVHPLYGMAIVFRPLALRLGDDQPFYAFQARGVEDDDPPYDRIEAMAERYIEAMREEQPRGPYRIGGFSMGAIVAFEMARQLQRAGEEVARLVVLDMLAPRVSGQPAASTYMSIARLFGLTLDEDLDPLGSDAQADRMARAMAQLIGLPPDIGASRRHLDVYRAHFEAFRSYAPGAHSYRGHLTLLRAQQAVDGTAQAELVRLGTDASYGWSALVDGVVEVHRVPGHHLDMIAEPHAQELAAVLRRVLDERAG
jgi:acyl transferase domain-containing protein/thioesterase domain-containing protein